MLTRRSFGRTLFLSLPFAAAAAARQPRVARYASRFAGVRIGAQTYCYRAFRDLSQPWSAPGIDRLMDRVVDAYVENQIDLAEFWIAMVEPPGGPGRGPTDPVARAALRRWRRDRPLDVFARARRKFTDAGIEIYSCMFNFTDDLEDDELEFAFDVARALGTNIISANCTRASIKRAAAFADRHKVYVAAHSENAPFDRDPDGMAYEKNLVEALGHSPFIRITLDTGHFTAFGGDAVRFVREHHDRMANLHLKDRLRRAEDRNDQNTTEWGKGDAPIVEVLRLMRQRRSSFAACIEYEYAGTGTPVEEMRKCLDYARRALTT
jgi:sugar phosphate isomerase/epimerase